MRLCKVTKILRNLIRSRFRVTFFVWESSIWFWSCWDTGISSIWDTNQTLIALAWIKLGHFDIDLTVSKMNARNSLITRLRSIIITKSSLFKKKFVHHPNRFRFWGRATFWEFYILVMWDFISQQPVVNMLLFLNLKCITEEIELIYIISIQHSRKTWQSNKDGWSCPMTVLIWKFNSVSVLNFEDWRKPFWNNFFSIINQAHHWISTVCAIKFSNFRFFQIK